MSLFEIYKLFSSISDPKGGKQLRNVALLSNDFRDNFDLKIVQEDGIEIGVTNGNEWHNPSIVNTFDPCKKRYYTVTIAFTASNHGTYRQNVIFGFRRNPVYLQKICADYLPINDYKRIQLATKYQISQMSPIWGNPYEFDSISFMSFYTDPREIKLSKIYPLPDKQNFFLTQDTLSKKELTPQNYRGRWHEMITLEEIARHEQLSRYNHISYVRLLSSYELTTNNSTETKYAPPGELFAQVRFLLFFFSLRRQTQLFPLFVLFIFVFQHVFDLSFFSLSFSLSIFARLSLRL